MDKKTMNAAELMGFSGGQVEPLEIELEEGLTIKVKPLGLRESLESSSDIQTDTPAGMAKYIGNMIAQSIVEPVLTEEQKDQLAVQIEEWPTPIVNRITEEYYDKLGLRGTALEEAVIASESFLEESPSNGTE